MSGISVDAEHGVNPTLLQCFFCCEPKGVALMGKLKPKAVRELQEAGLADPLDPTRAPRQLCLDMEPCEKCAGYMKQGIILISVRDNQPETSNPYRTGGWVVVREELLDRMIESGANPEVVNRIRERRYAFVDDQIWDGMGLPREGGSGANG